VSAQREIEQRRLPALAVEIGQEITMVERGLRAVVPHAIRAGELLIEAKGALGHGEWLPWLEANFAMGEHTARNYMRLARHPNRDELLDLTKDAALKRIATSKGGRNGHRAGVPPEWTGAEKRAAQHAKETEAWKRVLAVNGAAQKVRAEQDTILAAIENNRDRGAVEALAGSVQRSIAIMQRVSDAAFERLTPGQAARVWALLRASGYDRDGSEAER
jgi:hypothetical protein